MTTLNNATLQATLISDNYELFDFDFTVGTFDNEPFLIVSSHDNLAELESLVESNGFKSFELEYGFDDEYTTCYGCNKIIRTSPTHYGWSPDYHISDNGIYCLDCIDMDEYIEDFKNNPRKAVSDNILSDEKLEAFGYVKMNNESYESGLHVGMNDKPIDIYNKFKTENNDILFKVANSQFYQTFDIWVSENNEDDN